MSILLLLAACQPGGNYLDDELKCGANPYAWWNDLGMYVDMGESDRDKPNVQKWDLEYEPAYIKSLKGKYNGLTGDLEYAINYTGDYYLVAEETVETFDNYGTIFRNGNLDTRAMVRITDVLGNTELQVRRDERKGCYGSTKYRWVDEDGNLPRSPQYTRDYEIVSDSRVEWSATSEYGDGSVLVEVGSWNSQHVHETVTSFDSTQLHSESVTKKKASGAAKSVWTQDDRANKWFYEGTTDSNKDGSYKQVFSVTAEGEASPFVTVTIQRNYDGSGTGFLDYGDATCDRVYTADDSCTYTCSDGDSGNC
jgi:hypothetical protein